jgi:hypothetical protein
MIVSFPVRRPGTPPFLHPRNPGIHLFLHAGAAA